MRKSLKIFLIFLGLAMIFLSIGEGKFGLISQIKAQLEQTAEEPKEPNIDLSDLVADIDLESRKSILYMPEWPGVIEEEKAIFIPYSAEGTVYVCPNAASISEINPRCPDKIILKEGEIIEGLTLTTTNYQDKEYYLVLGFENGGGAVNLPPTADDRGPSQGYSGLPITFDASHSTDPNNDPLQYRWDFNNDGVWDTDWLTTSTVNHIWNNDYQGMITLEASDGQFSSFASSSVAVKSPRTLKQEAVSELEKAKTGDKTTDKNLNQIIWFVNQSLNENLWQNGSHLSPPETGVLVFNYEISAVKLMTPKIELKGASEKLAKADELLAEASLYEAKNAPVQNQKLQKIIDYQIKSAEEELNKAEEELTKNKLSEAISRFAKSWLHSQLAIKFAHLSKP